MASGLVKGLTEICISFRCACTVHWATSLQKLATWPFCMEFSTNHFCFRTFGVVIVTFKRSSLSNQLENVVFNFEIVQSHCLTFSFIQITIFVIRKDRQRFFLRFAKRSDRSQRHKTILCNNSECDSLTQRKWMTSRICSLFALSATNTNATLPVEVNESRRKQRQLSIEDSVKQTGRE